MTTPRLLSDFLVDEATAVEQCFQHVSAVVFQGSRAARVERLSAEAQVLYLTYVLSGEVLNGGFSQFFTNSSGDHAEETQRAVNALGVAKYQELYTRALKLFEGQPVPRDRVQRYELVVAFEQREPDYFDAIDEEFYAALRTEPLGQAQLEYLRRHSGASVQATTTPVTWSER